jgi:hypothetical protein
MASLLLVVAVQTIKQNNICLFESKMFVLPNWFEKEETRKLNPYSDDLIHMLMLNYVVRVKINVKFPILNEHTIVLEMTDAENGK